MLRDMASIAVSLLFLVGAFTFAVLNEPQGALPCEAYLNSFGASNPPPTRDDPAWPRYADCYYIVCGTRL